jgi:hypothetical protein
MKYPAASSGVFWLFPHKRGPIVKPRVIHSDQLVSMVLLIDHIEIRIDKSMLTKLAVKTMHI